MGQRETDQYPTPPMLASAITARALRMHPRASIGQKISVVEPGAGKHAPFAMEAAKYGHCAMALELQPHGGPRHVPRHMEFEYWSRVDFLGPLPTFDRWDLVITNPPFSLAQQFIEAAYDIVAPDGLVVMLLQTGFIGSKARIDFWHEYQATQRDTIRPRPGFVKSANSKASRDMREYEMIVWAGPALRAFLEATGRHWCATGFLDCPGPKGWGTAKE